METARSDTTLTDRSGCRDRTFEATSCTQIDRAMRCAIPNSNLMNCTIPESSVAFALPPPPPFDPSLTLPRLHFVHSRLMAANVDGTAANSTDIASTIPMSSSSDRWASCAASSSSCAMPRDTENARSDPREPSAPVVAMQPARERSPERNLTAESLNYTMTSSEVRAVSHELCNQKDTFVSNPVPATQLSAGGASQKYVAV